MRSEAGLRGARRGALLLGLLTLHGCLPAWDIYEARLDWLTDGDGDGLSEQDGDCDDRDPDRLPGAAETCNRRDDDCDGDIDEEPVGDDTTWAPDSDRDGAGAAGSTVISCEAPGEGYTLTGGDCDDDDPTILPGATERCNGTDDDCDGATDEDDAADAPTWFLDRDGDTYGQDSATVVQCAAPEGYAALSGDCDDEDDAVNPGAAERCNGSDDDCDGTPDDPPVEGPTPFLADHDDDGFGDESATDGRCAAAEGYVEVGGDCDDADPSSYPGAEEVCNDGADNDCDGGPGDCVWPDEIDLTDHPMILPAHTYDILGSDGASGDLNGDGAKELIIGASNAYNVETGAITGKVLVFEPPIVGSMSMDLATLTFTGSTERQEYTGHSLDIGDINGDGLDDLLIGAPNMRPDAEAETDRMHILYGPLTSGGPLDTTADWSIRASAASSDFGQFVSNVGDVNGDGTADFGTGSRSDDSYSGNSGAVYLFTNTGSGSEFANTVATARLYGTDTYNQLGDSLSGLDFDGDGFNDLLIGAPGADNVDAASAPTLLFMGPVTGERADSSADFYWLAEVYGDFAGCSVDRAGDLNEDGFDDILIGAYQSGTGGAAYVVWGGSTPISGSLIDADVKIRSTGSVRRFGTSISGLGDLNNDGTDDIAIVEDGNAPRSAFIYHGPLTNGVLYDTDADITLTGDSSSDDTFTAIFNAGDLTLDGVDDLVITSPYRTSLTDGEYDGGAYVVAGVGL